jgi:hypothetical protein
MTKTIGSTAPNLLSMKQKRETAIKISFHFLNYITNS